MNPFNVGDKVKRIRGGSNSGLDIGDIGTVESHNGPNATYVLSSLGRRGSHDNVNLQLVESFSIKNNNKNMVNIKDSFTLAFKAEPEKSFRKVGVTNGDDFLTEDGQKIFLSWLLKKNGADFKTEVVDGLLADMEKDSK